MNSPPALHSSNFSNTDILPCSKSHLQLKSNGALSLTLQNLNSIGSADTAPSKSVLDQIFQDLVEFHQP